MPQLRLHFRPHTDVDDRPQAHRRGHASERLRAGGLAPLPHISPHARRRTYVPIARLANNFDVLWVMNQVGHTDSKMTLDVYAQLQQRAKREHGASFDRLVRAAREELRGGAAASPAPSSDGNHQVANILDRVLDREAENGSNGQPNGLLQTSKPVRVQSPSGVGLGECGSGVAAGVGGERFREVAKQRAVLQAAGGVG